MKKTKLFKLSIPTPCHENWENMTPNERGRHCDSCNKTVIDFSLFTDKQLAEFFTKATDKICGKLSKFQLERQLVYTEPARYAFFHKLLFGGALAAGLTTTATAQQNDVKPQSTTKTDAKTNKQNATIESINPAISQELPVINEKELVADSTTLSSLKESAFIDMVGGITMVATYVDTPMLDDKTKQFIDKRANGIPDRAPTIFPKYKEGHGL